MQKFCVVLLVIVLLFSVASVIGADSLLRSGTPQNSSDFYTIASSENTFSGVYNRMHVYLNLNKYPIPEPESVGHDYPSGQHEEFTVLRDDDNSYDYIGYVCLPDGTRSYIIWSWSGYHEDGSLIGVDSYYALNGVYLGNVQHNYSSGAALSSRNSPFYHQSGSLYGMK